MQQATAIILAVMLLTLAGGAAIYYGPMTNFFFLDLAELLQQALDTAPAVAPVPPPDETSGNPVNEPQITDVEPPEPNETEPKEEEPPATGLIVAGSGSSTSSGGGSSGGGGGGSGGGGSSDGGSSGGGGSLPSTPSNSPPVLNTVADMDVNESDTISFQLAFSDPDADSLSCFAENLPAGATFNKATCTFNWTPAEGDAGTYATVKFKVTDNGNPPLSAQRSIKITVKPANKPPKLHPIENKQVDELEALSFQLEFSDPDDDNVACSAENLPAGSSFNKATCTFSWTPSESDANTYENVVFKVTDDGNPPLSDQRSIKITVREPNKPPKMHPVGNQQVDELELLSFQLEFSDPDDDNVACSVENQPAGSVFDTATCTFSWTPGEVAGVYENVVFKVTDNGDPPLSDEVSIRITVVDVSNNCSDGTKDKQCSTSNSPLYCDDGRLLFDTTKCQADAGKCCQSYKNPTGVDLDALLPPGDEGPVIIMNIMDVKPWGEAVLLAVNIPSNESCGSAWTYFDETVIGFWRNKSFYESPGIAIVAGGYPTNIQCKEMPFYVKPGSQSSVTNYGVRYKDDACIFVPFSNSLTDKQKQVAIIDWTYSADSFCEFNGTAVVPVTYQ